VEEVEQHSICDDELSFQIASSPQTKELVVTGGPLKAAPDVID